MKLLSEDTLNSMFGHLYEKYGSVITDKAVECLVNPGEEPEDYTVGNALTIIQGVLLAHGHDPQQPSPATQHIYRFYTK